MFQAKNRADEEIRGTATKCVGAKILNNNDPSKKKMIRLSFHVDLIDPNQNPNERKYKSVTASYTLFMDDMGSKEKSIKIINSLQPMGSMGQFHELFVVGNSINITSYFKSLPVAVFLKHYQRANADDNNFYFSIKRFEFQMTVDGEFSSPSMINMDFSGIKYVESGVEKSEDSPF